MNSPQSVGGKAVSSKEAPFKPYRPVMEQLSLMQFSRQETVLTDYGVIRISTKSDDGPLLKFPLKITWAKGSQAGVISGQWQRRNDGSIEAVYQSRLELIQCLDFGLMAMGSSLEELQTKLQQKKGCNYD